MFPTNSRQLSSRLVLVLNVKAARPNHRLENINFYDAMQDAMPSGMFQRRSNASPNNSTNDSPSAVIQVPSHLAKFFDYSSIIENINEHVNFQSRRNSSVHSDVNQKPETQPSFLFKERNSAFDLARMKRNIHST